MEFVESHNPGVRVYRQGGMEAEQEAVTFKVDSQVQSSVISYQFGWE